MTARALGYRLLGRGFDYLLHLRPAEWPIMAVHLLTGSALAIGLAGILEGEGGWSLWAGAAAFVVGINGGTRRSTRPSIGTRATSPTSAARRRRPGDSRSSGSRSWPRRC